MTGALTYWVLNAPFLGAALLVALAALLVRRAPLWRVLGLTALGVLLLTGLFDNVLVGTGIVGYDSARISGAFVGVAPIEDFSYAVAAVLLLPSLWRLLTPPPKDPPAGEGP
ncbi:MAG TPA: lycopene cyclase domain-containing protein [Pseudolysinimonas sp.]|nr:lycopene cyclase [Schumannella sp.]HEV7741676.1 lycopene cyclase domain-containing protein [Pseudolysinimonas sp.]